MTPRYTKKDAQAALKRIADLLGFEVGYGPDQLWLDYLANPNYGGYIVKHGRDDLLGREGFAEQQRRSAQQLVWLADDFDRLNNLGFLAIRVMEEVTQ